MSYKMYFGDVLFPAAPSKVKTKITNQNKTLTLINGEEVNLLKAAGLSEVSFDLLLPQSRYPFAEDAQPADYYLELLERLKTGRAPFQWILNRERPDGSSLFHSNLTVSLEDYEFSDDAEEGLDIVVSVELKQYRAHGTRRVTLLEGRGADGGTPAAVAAPPAREQSGAPQGLRCTVQKGDSLWLIAKRQLGDGTRWREVWGLNRDTVQNPNLIKPGQVLTLPGKG